MKHYPVRARVVELQSPSPRKAWIETNRATSSLHATGSRLPPGRRGLKRERVDEIENRSLSPSPRKAWIETRSTARSTYAPCCRLPPGRRGLKLLFLVDNSAFYNSRLPPGRRGLKPVPTDVRIVTDFGRLPPGRRGLKLWTWDYDLSMWTVAFPPEGVD